MRFTARVIPPGTPEVTTAELEAADEAAARSSLQAQGVVVVSVAASQQLGLRQGRKQGYTPQEFALLCRELRSLIGAGLSVTEALDALSHGQRNKANQLAAAVSSHVQRGLKLSAAFAQIPGVPELLVASIQASERTSNLVEALDGFLSFDASLQALKRKAVSAAIYPGVVVTAGAAISLFLLAVVVPRFAALYGQLTESASWLTRGVLTVSVALREYPWAFVALLALAALGLLWGVLTGHIAKVFLKAAMRNQWLRGEFRHLSLSRTYASLNLLVRGGYTLADALQLCARTQSDAETRSGLNIALADIQSGKRVSEAFARGGLTDPLTERLIRSGERGGRFEEVLASIATRHAEAFSVFIERATRIIEPLLLLGVALLVGGLVVLLYMPIFDVASSIR